MHYWQMWRSAVCNFSDTSRARRYFPFFSFSFMFSRKIAHFWIRVMIFKKSFLAYLDKKCHYWQVYGCFWRNSVEENANYSQKLLRWKGKKLKLFCVLRCVCMFWFYFDGNKAISKRVFQEKKKHAKFSEKQTFLTPCVSRGKNDRFS